MVLLNIQIFFFDFRLAIIPSIRTIKVVVFMPPATPPGAAPINIKIIIIILVIGLMLDKSTVINPAVLADTDWKVETSSLSPKE